MRKFIEMIQTMTEENFETMIKRLVARQTICAFFSTEPTDKSLEFISELRRERNLNVRALITLSGSPTKESVDDIEIVDLKNFHLLKPSPSVIFVADDFEYRIASSCLDGDIEIINWSKRIQRTIDAYKLYMSHISDIYDLYDSFIDEESKRVLRGYLLAKVSSKLSCAVFANTPHYICQGFLPEKGDVFIDGGAYDGSTAKRFHDMGCNVFGFEMDEQNYALARKLSERINSAEGGGYNFLIENLGLGAYDHDAAYTHLEGNGGGSKLTPDGENVTRVVTLDSYVAEHNLSRVDFIKLDVEGAELDVLRGAANSIARWKPKLAISAYHKADDLWVLTKFIKSVRPDYEFALRHWPTTIEDDAYLVTNDRLSTLVKLNLGVNCPRFFDCVLMCR